MAAEQSSHDDPAALAARLGILPTGSDEVLKWVPDDVGGWRELTLGEVQERQVSLQAILARGALSVWVARCRSLGAWWRSEIATPIRKRAAAAVVSTKRAREGDADAEWQSKRPRLEAEGSRQETLRQSPKQMDYGPMVSKLTPEEEEAEAIEAMTGGVAFRIPWW
jgi:hypothetical protein